MFSCFAVVVILCPFLRGWLMHNKVPLARIKPSLKNLCLKYFANQVNQNQQLVANAFFSISARQFCTFFSFCCFLKKKFTSNLQTDFLAALSAYLSIWIIQPRFRPIGNVSVLSLYRSPPICQTVSWQCMARSRRVELQLTICDKLLL
jgi:hypothetical protein